MENMQDYTLAARRGTEPLYALIVISGVRQAPGSNTAHVYMVEKVQPVNRAEVEMLRPLRRRLARFAMSASRSTATQSSPIKWTPERAPDQAKKARRLGDHPADAEMLSPIR